MTDAPDRIWARPEHDDENSYGGFWIKGPVEAGATEYIRADLSQAAVEALEAKLAKAVGLLEAWVNVAAHCTIEEGVCCCGENMDTHSDPMDCGHLPVDHGAYVVVRLVEKTLATLAELTGGKDD